MAYHIEKGTGDLVIDGFEKGIAPSPHSGIGDMKNLNISSIPGEVMVNYARTRQTQYKTIANQLNAFTSVQLVALAGSSVNLGLLRGTWIHITSSSITNVTNGSYYYVKSSTSGIITISTSYEGAIVGSLGITGTATFDVVAMGQPLAYAIDYETFTTTLYYYVLDNNGLVWVTPTTTGLTASVGQWFLLDHTPVTNATGIFVYGSYVHVISDSIYYKPITSPSTAWAILNGTSGKFSSGYSHYSFLGSGSGVGTVFICNADGISTLAAIPGVTYDATGTNGVNYTFTDTALVLPSNEIATSLAEIPIGTGVELLIGGYNNKIYVWDEIAAFYSIILLPENNTAQLLTVSNLVYIFAGSKGNIYVTNGSSVTTVISVPDYVANFNGADQDPYFTWGGVMYLRGRVWFSIKAPNCGGIWSFVPTINYYVEQDTGASLRMENQNSYSTYDGVATILFAPQLITSQLANGPQYWAGWDDGSAGASSNPYGIDFSDTGPFLGDAIIESDAIPTGTFLQNRTFNNIEYKMTTPLLNGESVVINYRSNLTDPFVPCGTSPIEEAADRISGYYTVSFESTQWLQLQVILTASAISGSSSFCRIKELRVR